MNSPTDTNHLALAQKLPAWPKALIFDFDFTLGDSSLAIIECVRTALTQLDLPPVEDREILQMVGWPLDKVFGRFAPGHVQAASKIFMSCADAIMTPNTHLYPGVAEAIRLMAGNGHPRLALVSTKIRRRLEEIMRHFALREAFDSIVGGDDVTHPKPAPDPVLAALRALQCRPKDAVMIGDSPADAGSALAAGVSFIGVTSGVTNAAMLREVGARRVFDNTVAALTGLGIITKGGR